MPRPKRTRLSEADRESLSRVVVQIASVQGFIDSVAKHGDGAVRASAQRHGASLEAVSDKLKSLLRGY